MKVEWPGEHPGKRDCQLVLGGAAGLIPLVVLEPAAAGCVFPQGDNRFRKVVENLAAFTWSNENLRQLALPTDGYDFKVFRLDMGCPVRGAVMF